MMIWRAGLFLFRFLRDFWDVPPGGRSCRVALRAAVSGRPAAVTGGNCRAAPPQGRGRAGSSPAEDAAIQGELRIGV